MDNEQMMKMYSSIKANPGELVKQAARKRLINFARYMQPDMVLEPFHVVYYTLLDKFAHGEVRKMIVQMPPQHGKQLSDSTLVPTPTGIKKHGDLKVGDYVFGRNGKPVKVLWTSPKTQSEYIITFSDGSKVECHGNHEWVVYNRSKHKEETLETKAIFSAGNIYKGNRKLGSRYNYQIDPAACVAFTRKKVDIDPYTLGAWLGDGKSSASQITIGNGDYEIISKIPYRATSFWKQKNTGVDYFYFGKALNLSAYGLLNNKHIPDAYIFNSVRVRKEIIAGLIDTDGYVYKNGRITISNTNKRIIESAAFILRSLGQSVSICEFQPATSSSGIKGKKVVYQLCFTPTTIFPTVVPRKKITQTGRNKKRAIISIEKKDGLEFGNCIQVEGGVYLVGTTFIPTHNSEGSSRKLPSFMLGLNPDRKVCIGSYAATIARDFNRDVQRIIDTNKYRELFPETYLNGSNGKVASNVYIRTSDVIEMVGHKGSLRVVGRGGALTSKTVDIAILDDVYKDYKEGNSPIIRESAWKWYTTVVKSRLHNDSQELIVFTRWHEDDLIGRIEKSGDRIIDIKSWKDLENIPKGAWVRINFEGLKTGKPTEIDPREPGEALWENRHSKEKLQNHKQLDEVQFECLYQGNPGSAAGRLYSTFKTYTDWREWGTFVSRGNYTDCADKGDDNLCSISYIKVRSNQIRDDRGRFVYFFCVTDVIYTDEPIEVTTQSVPMMMNRNATEYAFIESNNGGRAFAKIIEPKTGATIKSFTQTDNKESRIITNAGLVTFHIIMPFDWQSRYPKFYESVTRFLRKFNANTHDDAEDCLTGIIEKEMTGYEVSEEELRQMEEDLE